MKRSSALLFVATCALVAVGVGCKKQQDELVIARCKAGDQLTCSCGDGQAGVQLCDASGTFGACGGCPAPAGCAPGVTAVCSCVDGDRGTQVCNSGGAFDSCNCARPTCAASEIVSCACTNGLGGTQSCLPNGSFSSCDCEAAEEANPPPVGVLDFPDPSASVETHANHGTFWSTGKDLGRRLYWDAWVAPRTSGYLVSDGYGTAHALRWGPVLQNGQLVFQGELYTTSGAIKFSAGEGPAPGEWGHHAISMVEDSAGGPAYPSTLFIYWNGICVGLTRLPAVDRQAGVLGNGDGTLYVMGPRSAGLGGRLAAVRAFDQFSPFANKYPMIAFVPERALSGWIGTTPADFLADYTRPGTQIDDFSPSGYAGGDTIAQPTRHPGTLETTIPATGTAVLPHWFKDPESPYGTVGAPPVNTHEIIPVPDPAPAGALVFDSFSRRAQNFVWQLTPTLGQTEAGSLGPLIWSTATTGPGIVPAPFGIMNGRAVYLERQVGAAWVNVQTSDQDIRIDRFHPGWGYGITGIAFRVADGQNWGFLFADSLTEITPDQPGMMALGHVTAGVAKVDTVLRPLTDNWTRLRLVAAGTTVTAYIDDGEGGWTQLGMLPGQVASATATGAGLAGAPSYPQAYSLWRGDNFTVCAPGGC